MARQEYGQNLRAVYHVLRGTEELHHVPAARIEEITNQIVAMFNCLDWIDVDGLEFDITPGSAARRAASGMVKS